MMWGIHKHKYDSYQSWSINSRKVLIERREAHGELERKKSMRARVESERLDPRTGIPDHYTTFD